MKDKYIVASNIKTLAEALGKKDDNTYILAGGTDLTIRFIKNQVYDYKIIDISKCQELRSISISDDTIKIGSCVTMTEIENNIHIKEEIPALVGAAYNLGSTQIRNRATIGGNLANAAQCGDTIPVLFAYDAIVEILNSKNNYRYENVRDFVTGIGRTTLLDDEIITSIIVKRSQHLSGFSKIGSRKTVTISKINCCGKVLLDKNKLITEAEIYLGAVGIKPIKADLIENQLVGKCLDSMVVDFEDIIEKEIEKAIPNRSSKYYKKIAAIGLVKDMLENLGGSYERP